MKHLLLTTIAAVVLVGCEVKTLSEVDRSLITASKKGKIVTVKKLLAVGADVNAKNKNGDTPLNYAAFLGHKEIVELLVANGANVNAKGLANWTPLHLAARNRNGEIVELLIENGAYLNTYTSPGFGGTPLDVSDGEIAKLLRKHGGKTGAELTEASDALIRAARKGDIEAVKHAIAAGADVNAKNMIGETPLDYAVFWEESEIAKLLRKHGGKTKKELKAEGK